MAINHSLTNKLNITGVAFFFCFLVIAGMLTQHFARALSSVGVIGLGVTALFAVFRSNTLGDLRRYPSFIGIMMVYVLHLTGFFQTEPGNFKDFERDLVMKLPLLVLPFAFAVLPVLSRTNLNRLYYLFVLCVFLGTLYSGKFYFTFFERVNEMYKHSKVMLTPTNHVRFSLMIGFAVIIGYRFIQSGFYWFRKWEKWLLAVITVWMFVFLHILAVRSGLVAFYVVAFLGLGFDFFFRKQYKRSLFMGLGLGAALLVAFYTLPTFHNKFFLTIEDVKSVSEVESAHDYSIAGRVYSYKVAMAVFKENPVFGIGVGNMEPALGEKYKILFPDILDRGHILPHNQYIYILTAFGILGFLVFLVGFYYPLFRNLGRFEPLFLFHYIIISLSFIFETTLETQVGLNYSIIFILLPLWYFRSSEHNELTWKNGTFFA
jgi:O-antigen ligase